MLRLDCNYNIREDIGFILESERINMLEFSERTGVSRATLNEITKTGRTTDKVCEKIYSYIYDKRYRMNLVKEELLKEKHSMVLFHGSRKGLSEISIDGSRANCDFGCGFYLGEAYKQALAFVYEDKKSSAYSFVCDFSGLNIKQFECNLDWMLAICYYRGTLGEFADCEKINRIIDAVESADVVVAPIADNKMFYIMSQFTQGEINADVALHSLSASNLGMQYILRTDKALERIVPIEKYYISNPEREDCRISHIERSYEIDTKLKLARREYKTGLYIEELLDEKI